jgi:cytochrome P450
MAIEEILRYDSPVQLLGRVTKKDYTIENQTIPAGAPVTLVIGSANRDEKIFESANQFIIDRKPNRHVSFGSGIHFCLGDWLGRAQAQLAIVSFFENFKNVTLASHEIQWNKNLAVRSMKNLPVATE